MGVKKQNSRKKAENGDFQVVGSLLYAHYPIYSWEGVGKESKNFAIHFQLQIFLCF